MVRQYKIHTNLDSDENKTFDMTNGLIRFYEPSNLGLNISSNIWSTQGIGVLGNSNITHPPIDFKLETFGNDLHENYQIFNEFINSIIKEKYITLEYTSELGTYYADIKMSEVSKTEGYGFNGTFSEKISFDPITMWYVYEQVKLKILENGKIVDNTKIYTNGNTTVSDIPANDFGDNLLNNSTWNLGKGDWTFTVGTGANFEIQQPDKDKPRSNIVHAMPLATGTQQISNLPHPVQITAGQQITLSFDFKENKIPDRNATMFALRVFPENNTSNTQANSLWYENIVHSSVATDWATNPILEWKRFSYTFTPTADGWLDPVVYDSDTSGTHESWFRELKLEYGESATEWTPSKKDKAQLKYTYDYTYYGEDNIERFSKWEIKDDIFSMVVKMIPAKNNSTKDKGIRFLDAKSNEYTAFLFNLNTTNVTSIQINTDINDEYYIANVGDDYINIFSNLNFQKFRTRIFQKGTMELIDVTELEMNVKRKVEFV
ncbi:phage distal tail protein domain-containing protein [Lactococcus garvieae]|uniref:phage distal tail protein domain-containing protein n=1 Tax=Lactococcus garvieae TaxID=1363 RepID=UPI0018D9C004|nr:phage distal tail protein domain-containing protein [Lactococcus garvieae]QPS71428.1 phage baseplate protein [Lactococcus garvieae]